MARAVPSELSAFLGPFPDEVQETALRLRRRVLASMPTAHEFVWDATNAVPLVYTPSTRWQDGVIHICDRPPGARVEICTYHGYGELRERVMAAVEPVVRALPTTAGPVTIRQGFGGTEADLPVEVRRLLGTRLTAPAEHEVRIEYAGDDDALLEYRLLVAFTGLGLPLPSDADDDGPLAIDGEARGVVALWLAARGLELDDALHLATVENPGDADENLIRSGGNDAFERGLAWPTRCGPVVWSPQDLEAARALIRAPEAEVAAVIEVGSDRWSDPTTGTDELLAELGLPSAAPHEEIVTRTESFC